MSATPAPAAGLTLGTLHVPTPVVLAPMAGITNAAYRRLCAEQGAGLYVCEMITSRGLVEGDQHTKDMLVFDELETTRSVQLYGTDPVYVGKATEILCAEYGVAHIDLNFGCPVPKVTRKGGGGALPWKRGLLADILEHAVRAAAPYGVPVTMKTRKGIDEDHLTYLDAGRIAQESGCAAIALHGRTVAQAYSGRADWDAIGELAASVDIPVLGNGDIWEAADALRMVEETGAAGVVVGRGCLGRPWLFRDLAAAFAGGRDAADPGRGARHDAPPRGAAVPAHGGGARLQGVPQARLVVPQGLRRRRHDATQPGPGQHAGRPRRAARRPRPRRAVPRRRARHPARAPGFAA
jgi:nifR3 family TIM-barrel protein